MIWQTNNQKLFSGYKKNSRPGEARWRQGLEDLGEIETDLRNRIRNKLCLCKPRFLKTTKTFGEQEKCNEKDYIDGYFYSNAEDFERAS